MAVLNTTSATDTIPRPTAPNAVPRNTLPSASASRPTGDEVRSALLFDGGSMSLGIERQCRPPPFP